MSKPDENSKLHELAELRRQNAELKAIVEKMESEQKKIEKELHRLSQAIEQSPVSVIVTDVDGNISYANPKALATTGYSKVELIGQNSRILNSGKKPKSEYKILWETISAGKEWFGEFQNKKKNGELYWESVSISPIFNEKQEIVNYLAVKEDITERKKIIDDLKAAKEKAEENEKKFSIAFHCSPSVSLITNIDTGEILEANNAVELVAGFSKAEIIENSTLKLKLWVIEEDREKFVELLKRNRRVLDFESTFRKKSGEFFIGLISGQMIQIQNQNCLLSIIHDITDIRNAETKLLKVKEKVEESEEKFSNLYESLSISYLVLKDGVCIECNKATLSIYGVESKEDIIGKSPTDYSPEFQLNHLKSSEVARKHVETAIENGFNTFEWIALRKNKSEEFIAKVSLKRFYFKNELYLQCLTSDITEQKNAEFELLKAKEKVEESEEKFKNLYESLSIAYLIIKDGVCIECNKAALEIYGIESKEEIIGKPPTEFSPEYQPNNEKSIDEAVRQTQIALKNGFHTFEWVAMRKNKELFDNEVSLKKFYYKNELYLQCLTTDITERKRIENELIAAKDKAEESDRLKTAFLANMSHEIRTPMNGILGFSTLLSEPGLESEEQQAYIKIIQKSGARMLNILSEIVEISKIESGAVDFQIKQLNINKKMESVYELFKPNAKDKSIHLSLKNSLQLTEPILNTDEGKLDSILTNLVKNAIKYTDEGSVEFGYNPKEIGGRNFLEFYVKDTGIGIKKDRQDAIFERFIQANIVDVEARQGAGLGLAIVKYYVEMLDGKVWVESETGKGSIFYFTLPFNSESKEKIVGQNDLPSEITHNQINPEISEHKILIVEDDETSVIFLSTIIKNITNNVLIASSGVDAVKICQSNPDINLVLMDIQMPEMNGYEATQQIRKFNKDVIIIAQTAFAMAGDREKAIEVGCNDYISKPIKMDELLALIQKYFQY